MTEYKVHQLWKNHTGAQISYFLKLNLQGHLSKQFKISETCTVDL